MFWNLNENINYAPGNVLEDNSQLLTPYLFLIHLFIIYLWDLLLCAPHPHMVENCSCNNLSRCISFPFSFTFSFPRTHLVSQTSDGIVGMGKTLITNIYAISLSKIYITFFNNLSLLLLPILVWLIACSINRDIVHMAFNIA